MGSEEQAKLSCDTSNDAPTPGTQQASSGGSDASELFALVYDELRAIAARKLMGERSGHLLQPTALVHEVYMKLAEQRRVNWRGKTHVLAIAAQAMRRVLIDHARAAQASKRGGDWRKLTLSGVGVCDGASAVVDSIALHEALSDLASLDERQARVAEARLYADMPIGDIAQALGVSERTVKNDWRVAKAWLTAKLAQSDDAQG